MNPSEKAFIDAYWAFKRRTRTTEPTAKEFGLDPLVAEAYARQAHAQFEQTVGSKHSNVKTKDQIARAIHLLELFLTDEVKLPVPMTSAAILNTHGALRALQWTLAQEKALPLDALLSQIALISPTNKNGAHPKPSIP